jgi:hypothetical protein
MLRRIQAPLVIAVALVLSLGPNAPIAAADELPPGGTFFDDDGTPQEGYIEAIKAADITRGCNPPINNLYCPQRALTRGEMASIFVRALQLPSSSTNPFVDTSESVHIDTINALAAAGITKGCDPPENTLFCPDRAVTRAEMAAFMVRAFGYTEGATTDYFTDDDGIVFEADINRLAAAGITSGCDGSRFCPYSRLTRAEMAVFIAKAMNLTPIVPPERPPPPYPDVGYGKRVIYGNDAQRMWLVDDYGQLVDTYLVSGRSNVPAPGTYHVYSKSASAWAGHGGITMKWMVRFAHGSSGLAIGFHAIPVYANGQPMQTEAQLGTYQSAGCVRQANDKARALYDWAPIGTTVIVLP